MELLSSVQIPEFLLSVALELLEYWEKQPEEPGAGWMEQSQPSAMERIHGRG